MRGALPLALVLSSWLAGACTPKSAPSEAPVEVEPKPSSPASEEPTSQPAAEGEGEGYEATTPRRLADGTEVFGGELTAELAVTPLSSILKEPERFGDARVKTQGVVERVCAMMGCWMELSSGDGGEALRAPMAGHAFFLPQEVVGRRATVEGVIHLRELSDAQKKHLEAEGAKATGAAVSLEAMTVAVAQR